MQRTMTNLLRNIALGMVAFVGLCILVGYVSNLPSEPEWKYETSDYHYKLMRDNKENFEATMRVYRKQCGEITKISWVFGTWFTTCNNGMEYKMWQTDCDENRSCRWHFTNM